MIGGQQLDFPSRKIMINTIALSLVKYIVVLTGTIWIKMLDSYLM